MRLKCDVNIVNRSAQSATAQKSVKAAFTQVALGRKPGHKDGPIFLMLCTMKNRNGDKFKISDNVERVFLNFWKEGKATLRLREPPRDILLSKANPSELSVFLGMVRRIFSGEVITEKALSILAPVSLKQVEKPVTSLVISKPSEYPLSIPKSLEKLCINDCLLRRVSPQLLSIVSLKELNLSSNAITSLPEAFANLSNLRILLLSSNKLTKFPHVLLTGSLPKVLTVLDLRHNEIERIPVDVVKLSSLFSLNLSYNKVRALPESFGMISSLRNVDLSNNSLSYLPGTMLHRTYEAVDFSNNPFEAQLSQQAKSDWKTAAFPFPSLAELAARVIIHHKIYYTKEDLDIHSIEYIKSAHRCLCGKACFQASRHYFENKPISSFLRDVNRNIPFLVYNCSKNCFARTIISFL